MPVPLSHRDITLPRDKRRLTALLVLTSALLTVMAATVMLVFAHQDAGDDRIADSAALMLTLDELNESLRGDLLQMGDGASAAPDALADLSELRQVVARADVSTLPAELQRAAEALFEQERLYTDEVAAGLAGPGAAYAAHRRTAVARVESLTDEVDAVRERIGSLSAQRENELAATKQRLLAMLVVVAAVCSALGVSMVRRVLHRVDSALLRLGETVRTVSAGDMTARTGVRRDDAMGALALAIDEMADGLGDAMAELKAGYGDQEGRGRFARALEQTDTEPEVHAVVSRAVATLTAGAPARLLIADASEMHLVQVTSEESPVGCCDVTAPGACPAIRGGRTLLMPSNGELDACPRLRDREGPAVSAVCTPVTFLGKALGVVQVLGEEGHTTPERTLHSLHDIAHLAGSRLGTMRALNQAQRQATVDPLTGLLNRRTLEDRARLLAQGGTRYAVAMLDLDHFKALNDSRGHEVGDRALKLFAQVLRDSLRSEDIVARYGGEEFVVVLPGCDASQAMTALLHVRGALRQAVAASGVAFTFSGGVTDSDSCDSWQVQLRIADAGLMACKQDGRDRLAIGDLLSDERRPVTSG
jgi:diguanylate cyclase (GGDEF)-like protein